MQEIYKKIIEKDCFLAKTLIENETKKDQERQKRGGALIRGGAHIRDNTVSYITAPDRPVPLMLSCTWPCFVVAVVFVAAGLSLLSWLNVDAVAFVCCCWYCLFCWFWFF